jgi:heme/copper-type cytochrome/quinol oxidase subunit 2
MRLQVLASSRDVIHSWAVPSAGIKIDCVPGYSSHRVMIFLLSGIYWGQCMEICGRYHHWMPIIVYFMKRDLFVLWCTHFVFFKDTAANVNLVDGFYTNHLNTVSFDKSSWLSN